MVMCQVYKFKFNTLNSGNHSGKEDKGWIGNRHEDAINPKISRSATVRILGNKELFCFSYKFRPHKGS
jgi:hypothetical protein